VEQLSPQKIGPQKPQAKEPVTPVAAYTRKKKVAKERTNNMWYAFAVSLSFAFGVLIGGMIGSNQQESTWLAVIVCCSIASVVFSTFAI